MGRHLQKCVDCLKLQAVDKKAWVIQITIVTVALLAYWIPELIKYYI